MEKRDRQTDIQTDEQIDEHRKGRCTDTLDAEQLGRVRASLDQGSFDAAPDWSKPAQGDPDQPKRRKKNDPLPWDLPPLDDVSRSIACSNTLAPAHAWGAIPRFPPPRSPWPCAHVHTPRAACGWDTPTPSWKPPKSGVAAGSCACGVLCGPTRAGPGTGPRAAPRGRRRRRRRCLLPSGEAVGTGGGIFPVPEMAFPR